MTNKQTLYTMFTTGRQNNTINDAAGTAVPNPTRGETVQVPDRRNGWPHIQPARSRQGPGHLLEPFDVDTHGYSDVWSNDISDVAIRARRQEDADEDAAWEATKVAKGWTNGLPPDASAVDASDFAIGTRREQARDARIYEASLTKRGAGTLILTGNDTWYARIGDEPVAPGNVLNAGEVVRVDRDGRAAATVRSDSDCTTVRTAGELVLDGTLSVDVQGPLTPGSVLTIMSGRSISGRFHALPEGRVLHTGGHLFRVSYRSNRVTLTDMQAVPPGQN
jgi:uncharacterized Zn-binding protein involved in type VI secretion